MEANQAMLQSISESLQNIQDDLQTSIDARQKLESQHAENTSVHREFQTLSDSANTFRLVGPILLKQDKSEIQSTVDGRLDYITKEINRTETRIKELQDQSDKKRVELFQTQQRMQLDAQQQQA